jgi:hypothetical protein
VKLTALYLVPRPKNGTIPYLLPICLLGVDKDTISFTTRQKVADIRVCFSKTVLPISYTIWCHEEMVSLLGGGSGFTSQL